MPNQPPATVTPRASSSPARIASMIGGGIAALLAIGLLAAGGLLLWADGEKDRDGYLATATDPYTTTTSAIVTEDLDVDLAGADLLEGHLGNVRLKVEAHGGKPVFVGIAPTSDVADYLRGTAHATVTDVDTSPFRATYDTTAGDRAPVPPAGQAIWAASANGTGTQKLTWKVRDGAWSVVVMNADGSRGVEAGVSAGANVPFLDDLGWIALGGGVVLLLAAGAVVVATRRRP